MSAEKSLALPKASVKRIMKLSDEVQNVSAEAVIAVSKVTEDFLNQIVAQAHEVSQAHNRKTIKVGESDVDQNSCGYQLSYILMADECTFLNKICFSTY